MRVRLCREARSSKTSLVMQEISKSGILHYYDTTFLSHKSENSPGQSTAPISLVVYSSLSFPSYLLLLANRPRILVFNLPLSSQPTFASSIYPSSLVPSPFYVSHSIHPLEYSPPSHHHQPAAIHPINCTVDNGKSTA